MRFAQLKFLKTNMPKGVQAMVNFGNYDLSIVKNSVSYGNKQGLYEIAVSKDDEQTELGITEPGDTVKGYSNEEAIDGILLKMVFVTQEQGKQVETSK